MKKTLVLALALFGMNFIDAQVGINTSNPDPSAALDIQSTTGGLLIPRLTASEKNSITSPANGLLVYQTTSPSGFYYYNGTTWTHFSNQTSTPKVLFNNQIEYTIYGGVDQIGMIDVISSGEIYYLNSWEYPSNMLVQVTHANHGLTTGDYIYVHDVDGYKSYTNSAGATTNYFEVSNVISQDAFEIVMSEPGAGSGSEFTYQKAVKLENITISASGGMSNLMLDTPENSGVIVESLRIMFDGYQGESPFILHMPYPITTEDEMDLPIIYSRKKMPSTSAAHNTFTINSTEPHKIIIQDPDKGGSYGYILKIVF